MNSAISFAPENAKRQSSDQTNAADTTETATLSVSRLQWRTDNLVCPDRQDCLSSTIHSANRRTSSTKPKWRRPPIHLKIKIYTKNVYDPSSTRSANRELRTANSEATMIATPKTTAIQCGMMIIGKNAPRIACVGASG